MSPKKRKRTWFGHFLRGGKVTPLSIFPKRNVYINMRPGFTPFGFLASGEKLMWFFLGGGLEMGEEVY